MMPHPSPPAKPQVETGKFPDRRTPPSRLRNHAVRGDSAPSAAQRLLLASRVRAALDDGLSKWDRVRPTKSPGSV